MVTFPLMDILNIYRLDLVVRWFFDLIKSVAFRSLRALDSPSAILKKISSLQHGFAVLPIAFL